MVVRDGKPSFGKRNKKVHVVCRRCNRHSLNLKTKICSACGFGKSAKLRKYAWQTKKGAGARKRAQ